jgi:hypothetical protein
MRLARLRAPAVVIEFTSMRGRIPKDHEVRNTRLASPCARLHHACSCQARSWRLPPWRRR